MVITLRPVNTLSVPTAGVYTIKNQHKTDDLTVPYEEEVNGFTIYIEDNPDRWCGGYIWSVCQDGIEFDSGLEFGVADAVYSANSAIEVLLQPLLC